MRIAIIGAGIAGVTTAYELAAAGHQVIVFERRGSVAAEASFANAGLVVPGLALPWTKPSFAAFGFANSRWRAARKPEAAERQQRTLKLAQLGHECLAELRRGLQLDYERAEGALVLLRTAREQEAIAPGLALLQAAGIAHRELDAAQCRAAEPGINPETALHGGVLLPQAEVGNCRQFAHQLRLEAQKLGVQFRFHTTVRSIEPGAPAQLVHEYTPPQDGPGPAANGKPADAGDTQPAPIGPQQERFDAIVVCAAQDSAALLRPLKLKLPVATSEGFSITAPLRQLEAHPDLGPRASLFDQQRQVHISRIGQRVRVIGEDEAELHKVLNDWFPGAALPGQMQLWKGPHALFADGLPVLGASSYAGIWLNLGHGDAGWTLACGAAHVLTAQVAGKDPAVDVAGLDISRLA